MAKHDSNPKLIDGFYLLAFGLCAPGDEKCDRTPPDQREVAVCKRWLRRHAAPQEKINHRTNSYGLKHLVEIERCVRGGDYYVSNGSLIAAAIALGYRPKRIGDSPNAAFNMRLVIES